MRLILFLMTMLVGLSATSVYAIECGSKIENGNPVWDSAGYTLGLVPCISIPEQDKSTFIECRAFFDACGLDGEGFPNSPNIDDAAEDTPDPSPNPDENSGAVTPPPGTNTTLEGKSIDEVLDNKEMPGVSLHPTRYLVDMIDVCLACKFVEDLIMVMYDLGASVTDAFQAGARVLLTVMIVIFLMFNVAKLLMPFGPIDNVKKIKNVIISHIGIGMLCALFLTSVVNYWNIIFLPPVTAGMDYVSSMMDVARVEMNDIQTKISNDPKGSGTIYTPFQRACDSAIIPGADQSAPIVTAAELGQSVNCLMKEMQAALGMGVSAAFSAMMAASSEGGILKLPSVIMSFVTGLVLLIIYGPSYLTFPIKVVDVVMRWAIISVISPFLIVFFALPMTRYLALTSLRGLFQSVMELVMYGIVIALGSFVIVSIADDIDVNNNAMLINSVLFWRFFMAGLIITTMLSKAKSFATAIAYPRPNPKGMDVDVAAETASSMESTLNQMGGGAQKSAVSSAGKGTNSMASGGAGMIAKALGR